MRSNIAVPVLIVLLAAIAAVADECHIICADVKRSINAKSACSAFRNSLPRPKVPRYCQDAFKEAVDTNCYDACVNDGKVSSFHAESRLDQKCNRALNDSPRPLCHDACVKGFRSGIENMSASLLKRIAKSSPALLASLREDLKPHESTQRTHATAAAAAPSGAATSELGVEINAGRAIDAVLVEQATSESGNKNTDGKLDAEYEGGAPLNHEEQYQGKNKEAWESPPLPVDFRDVAEGSLEKADRNYMRTTPAEDGVVLSLPISVDDVEMELTIFEDDEPADVIFAFCKENMPDAGTSCVDQLILVVQDKLAVAGNPEMITE